MKAMLATGVALGLSLFAGSAGAQSSPLIAAPMSAGSMAPNGVYDYAPPPPLSGARGPRARAGDTGLSGAIRFKWPSNETGR